MDNKLRSNDCYALILLKIIEVLEETEKMKNQEEKTNKIVDTHTCFVLGEDLLVCFAIDSFAVGSGRENREE